MNIIITGASKGIGYATVKELGKLGNHNIIAIARDHSRLKALKNSFDGSKNSILQIIAFDLSEKNYQEVLFKKIETIFKLREGGKIDILINNAGYLINKPFQELDIEEWEQVFCVNLYAAVKLIKLLYPYFNDKSKSHIVNIGSMAGFQGTEKLPGLSAYSSSKAAIGALTECLATEFVSKNISVNCLALGAVQTEMLKNAFPDYQAAIQPKEIAKYIADFALNGQNYMNGKVLPVAFKN